LCRVFEKHSGPEHTLEEVGQSFAVTRERIRQIEAKALRKLGFGQPNPGHRARSRPSTALRVNKLKAFLRIPRRLERLTAPPPQTTKSLPRSP
jgi:hypothetical protein